MADLVPRGGLALLGAPDAAIGKPSASKAHTHALHLHLPPQVVKDLRAAKTVEVIFGSRPMLRLDDHKTPLDIAAPSPSFRHEYYSLPADSSKAKFAGLVGHRAVLAQIHNNANNAAAAAQRLKEQVQAYKADRESNQTTMVGATAGKLGRKPVRSAGLATASTSSRPSSSSLAPPNLAQQSQETVAQKFALLHLLAIRPASEAALLKKTGIPRDDLIKRLEKIAEQVGSEFTLDKRSYKDLDVWAFPYTDEDRKKAIDNAIHAFDRQRIPKQDKLWDMLNEPSQRGRGVCLSRLNIDPHQSRQPTEHRRMLSAASANGGLSPQPPSAQASPAVRATKKPSEKDLQQKRLFSKSGKAAGDVTPARGTGTADSARNAAEPKKPVQKQSETKAAASPAVNGQKRKAAALSADVVVDSDEEAAEAERDMQRVKKKLKSEPPVGGLKAKASPARPAPVVEKKTPVTKAATAATAATATAPSASTSSSQRQARKVQVSKPEPAPPTKVSQTSPEKKLKQPSASTASPSAHKNNYVSSWAQSIPSAVSSESAGRPAARPTSFAPSSSNKRPSSSDGDSSSKRIKTSQSHAPFASSPLTSVTSSSDNNEKQGIVAKRPDESGAPPKKMSPVSSIGSPRRMDLAEITAAREVALSDYLKLRVKMEKQGKDADRHLQAKISQKLDEYDFLTGEVASREKKSKKDVPIPCNVVFPIDCSVFLAKEYDEKLLQYNQLHDRVAKATKANSQDRSTLWNLHNELKHLAQLQKAAIDGENKAKREASLTSSTRSVSSASSIASAPFSRKQAIDEYARYHKMYNAWCSLRAELRAIPSYPKLPAAKLEEDRKMFAKLSELQSELLASFEDMRKLVARKFTGTARKTAGTVLSKAEAELLTWKTKSRIYEWCSKYEKMLTEFGEWTASDVEKLWNEQQDLVKDRLKIHRAVALEFGAKDEGSLNGIHLEDVIVKLGGSHA